MGLVSSPSAAAVAAAAKQHRADDNGSNVLATSKGSQRSRQRQRPRSQSDPLWTTATDATLTTTHQQQQGQAIQQSASSSSSSSRSNGQTPAVSAADAGLSNSQRDHVKGTSNNGASKEAAAAADDVNANANAATVGENHPPSNSLNKQKTASTSQSSKKKKTEYNPRWKGYLWILLASLINVSAVTNISQDNDAVDASFYGSYGASLSFGLVSLIVSFFILVHDRTQSFSSFNYTKAHSGHFEGVVLLSWCVWWIVGVAYQTQVGGIAYLAMNIYGSSWLSLAAVVYTLDRWSASKDILSIAEMTGVSATLPSWYVLWIASLTVLGTSLNMLGRLPGNVFHQSDDNGPRNIQDAGLGIAMGFSSSVVSLIFILLHYNLIQIGAGSHQNLGQTRTQQTDLYQQHRCCSEGGWLELVCSLAAIVMWIVGVSVLTQDGTIGATITGRGCRTLDPNSLIREATFASTNGTSMTPLKDPPTMESVTIDGCSIELQVQGGLSYLIFCEDVTMQYYVPGSNLYLALWTCLVSSFQIALQWKAQQALQFAQTSHSQQQQQQEQQQQQQQQQQQLHEERRAPYDYDYDNESTFDDYADARYY